MKEFRYTGSLSFVSEVVNICNHFLGYPAVFRHGTAGNVYAEYQYQNGLCILFTSFTGASYTAILHFQTPSDDQGASNAVGLAAYLIDSKIGTVVEDPNFMSIFLQKPEDTSAE